MLRPTKAYHHWLKQLKERIRSAQIKAALKVNAELLSLYWHLGNEIIDKEKSADWGDKWLYKLSDDLMSEFPEMKGFSHTNLKYIRRWVGFYNSNSVIGQQVVAQIENLASAQQPVGSIVQQVAGQLPKSSKRQQAVARSVKKTAAQKGRKKAGAILPKVAAQFGQQAVDQLPAMLTTIPWGHHLQIITKCKDINEALFYIAQTTEHNWSRAVLVHQMETGLYKRKGKALSNFEYTLPAPQNDLARELLKSSYNLDFLGLSEKANEKELEDALINHLINFLLELGNGFAFIGRQYMVKVEEQEFFIDLLFYHTRLHAYVVVELKMDDFKPEYAGKLNFYLSVIDDKLKTKDDQPSIGLLLCKKAGKLVVEYALKNMNKPMSVSEYHLTEKIPAKMKGKLPTIKEIEAGLKEIAE